MDDDEEVVSKKEHLRRLAAKTAKIEALEEAQREMKAKLDAMPDHSKIERRLQRVEAERDASVAEFAAFRAEQDTRNAIVAAGITDQDDIDLVRYRYSRLPEEGRPALDAWLSEAAKEDRHVGPLLAPAPVDTPAPTDTPVETPTETPQPAGLPAVNTGAVDAPPPAAMSVEAILAMPVSERIKPENREAIRAALKGTASA